MIKAIINKLKNIISNSNTTLIEKSYPYTHFEVEQNLKFVINNSIEEFRLKDWGGEKEYVLQMVNELRPNDIFYDIGSSVGLVSINAAKKLTNGKVYSFEPDPENILRLTENYKVNNLKNFSIQKMAVGDQYGKMKLYTSGSNGYSPSLQKVNGIENYIEVEVQSIDDLIDSNAIEKPNVIKIDIEGAEMIAIKGMKRLLESDKRPRTLFVELHPDFLPSFSTTTEEIFEYLSQFNYTIAESINREKQILCKLTSN